jgi:hypothetical protein
VKIQEGPKKMEITSRLLTFTEHTLVEESKLHKTTTFGAYFTGQYHFFIFFAKIYQFWGMALQIGLILI